MSSNSNSVASKYDYQGKENQEELGLNWHDFGARNYDAALGRWMNIDPLAEEFYGYSPYNAMMNDPINYIDPDGMLAWKPNGDGTWTAEAGDSAWTLHEDAGISFEKAKEILANTPKDNPQGNMGTYTDTDGVEKSAVDEGDVVDIAEKKDGFRVVPDNSDVVETNTSEMKDFDPGKDTTIYNKEDVKAMAQKAKIFLDFIQPDPVGRLVKSKYTTKKSNTRTTSTAPSTDTKKSSSKSSSSESVSPSQRKVISKKAKKTLKERKRQ